MYKAALMAFMAQTTDEMPMMRAVRKVVKRELDRLERVKNLNGRPRLEDSPQRQKWREYQRAYRLRQREEK